MMKDPLETYLNFLQRKEKEGLNFECPELNCTVENQITLLKKITDFIWKQTGKKINEEENQVLLDGRKKLEQLELDNYPHRKTVSQIYLNMIASKYLLDKYFSGTKYYQKRKIKTDNISLSDLLKVAATYPSLRENKAAQRFLSGFLSENYIADFMTDDDEYRHMILMPVYDELGISFFVKTRSVPLFVLGLAPSQFVCADGMFMCMEDFFNHDGLHAMDLARHNKQDMSKRYKRDGTWTFEQWRKYVALESKASKKLLTALERIADVNLKKALYLLLFELEHETGHSVSRTLNHQTDELFDIIEKIRHRYREGGYVMDRSWPTKETIGHLDDAAIWLNMYSHSYNNKEDFTQVAFVRRVDKLKTIVESLPKEITQSWRYLASFVDIDEAKFPSLKLLFYRGIWGENLVLFYNVNRFQALANQWVKDSANYTPLKDGKMLGEWDMLLLLNFIKNGSNNIVMDNLSRAILSWFVVSAVGGEFCCSRLLSKQPIRSQEEFNSGDILKAYWKTGKDKFKVSIIKNKIVHFKELIKEREINGSFSNCGEELAYLGLGFRLLDKQLAVLVDDLGYELFDNGDNLAKDETVVSFAAGLLRSRNRAKLIELCNYVISGLDKLVAEQPRGWWVRFFEWYDNNGLLGSF